ncbi:prolyl-tRNA synthetase [Gonapodya prolifera JEL478]|uniref:proline--tRNA ligase n=1 Tax=Gonapodya prolifera (strain JEL478) TaxID=1344416 RepID=A0A139B024_GONPJ|nr:prolyl-tRNA synthetase [Gonapodya prolifera JEL478]|eukprot:KXS22290.1 prolyl-tRNA synthetase [Gonapodya prolifera JEL478]
MHRPLSRVASSLRVTCQPESITWAHLLRFSSSRSTKVQSTCLTRSRHSLTHAFLPTQKLAPDQDGASQNSFALMVSAGLVRQSSSGIFSLLPFGLRTLTKIEAIIDDEMQAIGAQKLRLPLLLSPENWQITGRYEAYGQDLFLLNDRKRSPFLLSPTHEEEITALVAPYLTSSRHLPLRLYQVGTKFRDEPRPRAGLLRAREFVMKDLYTFDADETAAIETYEHVRAAYRRMFARIGVQVVQAEADSGTIGGTRSHEYHMITPVGEDTLLHCPKCNYAANVERAVGLPVAAPSNTLTPTSTLTAASRVSTDAERRIANALSRGGLATVLGYELGLASSADVVSSTASVRLATVRDRSSGAPAQQQAETPKSDLVVVLVRPDRHLNEVKLRGLPGFKGKDVVMLDGSPAQSDVWPDGQEMSGKAIVLVDQSLRYPNNTAAATTEAGEGEEGDGDGSAWLGDAFSGMTKRVEWADVHNVEQGDHCSTCAQAYAHIHQTDHSPSPSPPPSLLSHRAVEVAHAFYLGTRYSEPLRATFPQVDAASGKTARVPAQMGCYGVGVSRVLAAVVEACRDDKGIVWPAAVAPYTVCIVPLIGTAGGAEGAQGQGQAPVSEKAKAMQRDNALLLDASAALYDALAESRVLPRYFDCVIDDRRVSAGYKLTDAELVGYPYVVILGKRFLKEGKVEVVARTGRRDVVGAEAEVIVKYFKDVVV